MVRVILSAAFLSVLFIGSAQAEWTVHYGSYAYGSQWRGGPIFYSDPAAPAREFQQNGVKVIYGTTVYGYPASGPAPIQWQGKRRSAHIQAGCFLQPLRAMTSSGVEMRRSYICGPETRTR